METKLIIIIALSIKLSYVQPESYTDCAEVQNMSQTFSSGVIWGILKHQSVQEEKRKTSLSHESSGTAEKKPTWSLHVM